MITVDGTAIAQPTTVLERKNRVYTDMTVLSGRRYRHQAPGMKHEAELTWVMLDETDYDQLLDLFITGDSVTYLNDHSSYANGRLTFTGFTDLDEEPYHRPGLRKDLKVTIREE